MTTFAIEMFDGAHFIVTATVREGYTHPGGEAIGAIGINPVQLANVIIDLDTRLFIKNRTDIRQFASYYELEWFQRGDVTRMTAREFQRHVEILYRNR